MGAEFEKAGVGPKALAEVHVDGEAAAGLHGDHLLEGHGDRGRQPNAEEIAAESGIALEKVRKLEGYLMDQPVSLDREVASDDGRKFLDFIEDEDAGIGQQGPGHGNSLFLASGELIRTFIGLVKNAIENTPDEGRVEVTVKNKKAGVELLVRDAGIGIVEEHRKRIFEGFFPTQETSSYSSKKPYDFNAGGKGADLLRLKIFSERFDFKLEMSSSRCRYIPFATDMCPGKISQCQFCKVVEDCHLSGETRFTAVF